MPHYRSPDSDALARDCLEFANWCITLTSGNSKSFGMFSNPAMQSKDLNSVPSSFLKVPFPHQQHTKPITPPPPPPPQQQQHQTRRPPFHQVRPRGRRRSSLLGIDTRKTVGSYGSSLTSGRGRDDYDGYDGYEERKSRDVFEEMKQERESLKGVDPRLVQEIISLEQSPVCYIYQLCITENDLVSSILPSILKSISSNILTHRRRIQTSQSTITHRLEELENVRSRFQLIDDESDRLFEGMMYDSGMGEIVGGGGGGSIGGGGREKGLGGDENVKMGLGGTSEMSITENGTMKSYIDRRVSRLSDGQIHNNETLSPITTPSQTSRSGSQTPPTLERTELPTILQELDKSLSTSTLSVETIDHGLETRLNTLEGMQSVLERIPDVVDAIEGRIRVKGKEIEGERKRLKRKECEFDLRCKLAMNFLLRGSIGKAGIFE